MPQSTQNSCSATDRPAGRGRLRIFFGYTPEVGTTTAMLEAAKVCKGEGVNVLVGCLETRNWKEAKQLPEGLSVLPPQKVSIRGAEVHEFDLDSALAHRPDLVLVDDLAHANAAGLRHAKRWQDVEELLAAGIDVFATAYVQHVASLSDVVEQICGVTFRETFPDQFLERADEVTLIDLPPRELLQHRDQQDACLETNAADTLATDVRRESLAALRELALRQIADRVHEDVQAARQDLSESLAWPTRERILVCVGSSPTSAKVVRAAKRLADPLHAEWVAVHVETGNSARATSRQRRQVTEHLRLAESLGAEVVQLSGENVATELLLYARQRNTNKIVVGKTAGPRGWPLRRESLVERLVRDSGNIDVFVVRGIDEPVTVDVRPGRKTSAPMDWLGTMLSLGIATAVAQAFQALAFSEANLVMIYLLAIVFIGVRYGALHSALASVAAVLLFDVLFTKPHYAITVHDTEYVVTFSVMLGVGLLASSLTSRIRRQVEVARRNERRAESLYRLNRGLAAISGSSHLVRRAEHAVSELFDAHAVVFLPHKNGAIRPIASHPASFAADASEFAAAQWVCENKQPAGLSTDTLPEAKALYLPLATPNSIVGVLAVQPEDANTLQLPSARQLLDTCATQIALALARERLAEESQESRVLMETEKLRSSLLSAVSHDLRTPLAGIAGAASSLAASFNELDSATRRELLETICDEAERMSRLVENLLNMTRLSGGNIEIRKQWHLIDEVLGSALTRLQRHLGERKVETIVPDDVPLGHFDDVLLEQVLVNLIENAAKYSPPDSPISIEVKNTGKGLQLTVTDCGLGLQPGDEKRVFEMFYRGAQARPDRRGTGLGLAICKAIVEAHGGTIGARSREEGGTILWFELPSDSQPPHVDLDLPLRTSSP